MTDREAIILFKKNMLYWGNEPIAKDMVAADRLAISALQEREKRSKGWISVKDRLPDEPMEYIVMIKGAANPTTLLYDDNGDWFEEYYGERIDYNVTHWMPLPEPPKEDEKTRWNEAHADIAAEKNPATT